MSKNQDLGLESSRVVGEMTRCLCFLLARVPETAAARERGARLLRLPKAGALRRVRRFERMPDRLDFVGERPAAAGAWGAEEMRLALVLLVVVVMVGVEGRGVKSEEAIEIRDLGLEKGLRMKVDGLRRSSSVLVFIRLEDDSLISLGSTFSESERSRAI